MPGSDWSSSFYGNSQQMSKQGLDAYSQGIANGLDGGAGKKKAKAAKAAKESKPKPRGLMALTVTELRSKAKSKNLTIPSKCSKKADIVAYMRSKQ